MKKFFLFAVSLFIFFISFAQDSILFSYHYEPMHIYQEFYSQEMQTQITIEADDSILQKMKDNGFANPIIGNKKTEYQSVLTCDEIKNNAFPVTLEFIKSAVTSSSTIPNYKKTLTIPTGAIFKGIDTLGKSPFYYSLTSDSVTEDEKKELLKRKNVLVHSTSSSNKKMGIGDEYDQQSAISIPLPNSVLNMDMVTTYKLVSLTDSTANFDVKIKGSVNGMITKSSIPIEANGDGSGILIYDRKNRFAKKEELHFKIYATSKKDPISMKIALTSNSVRSYTIQQK